MWREKSLGESPGFLVCENRVDVGAVPEIGTRLGVGCAGVCVWVVGTDQETNRSGCGEQRERVTDWWPSGCGLPDRALSQDRRSLVGGVCKKLA